ncbi:nucleoside phosphorylase [Lactobacillus sp. ESL0731]|uniref:nucleoside phosphorylase n=1 Tax=unclassified Lactobacillus TaxID=2620435 RepID=UPI0023F6D3D0|nr:MULTISPECIES: nucleoside phosphorylase [unclassified Lactobacillus]WEV50451.1 nucleoside phosphorylase [Lactobacillus sp. ESL0700]WEV61581.1 nucleoside phosphorylase [Lactobacillus sp. ESL0731]
MSEPFLMQFDANPHAVLDPDHERDKLNYHFPKKLLFAFITSEAIADFLSQYPHRKLGHYDCFDGETPIYEVAFGNEKVTFCQAKIGASAAVELLDWLISYGVKQVLAIGSAGSLVDLPENYFLVPVKAIRDEGTSFHYLAPSNMIDLHSDYLSRVEQLMAENDYKIKEVITWTTDGFFRETKDKVSQFKQLGASCVEMECAAMAACANFRHVDFAQILFTADSLSNLEKHEDRGWGRDAHELALQLAAQILAKI